MKTQRTLLVICALGYATSTMIKKSITEFFEAQGVANWTVYTIGLTMAKDRLDTADLIVSSLGLNQAEYKVPVLNGVPLISGIGKDAVLQEILDNVKRLDG